MHAPPTTHPNREQLAAYGLGKLDDAETAAVFGHLETCETCRLTVEDTASDTFINALRAARPECESTLPSELANHPRFRLIRELGRGGMGVVYLAEHRLMERQVAIKVISKSLVENPKAVERFQREVRAAAKLDHANIVRAYDAEQAGDLHMLVMEYVEGLSLAQVLERRGPMLVADSCHYIRQAALALQHAHEQGMIHRDLKPQNLMLVADSGAVKVLDFGLARLASERPQGEGLTAENAIMGTPEYLAPEQATDAGQADIRADIYSLGCTLYCLLTGRPPFVGQTAMLTILAHRDKEAAPPHELRSDVPAELSAVVVRMIAKNPAHRYQSPGEAAEALAPFCIPSEERAEKGEEPRREVSAKRPRRALALAAAAAMLAIGLTLGIILLVQTPHGTIEIELNDPNARVEVSVDGTIHVVGVGKPLTVRAGEHHLHVTGDGTETVSRSFTVKRGDNPVLRVELKPASAGQNVRYLSDMAEFDVQAAEGRFAKKGNLGYQAGGSDQIRVRGKKSPNGLSMHAPPNAYAAAKYRVGKTARTFLASVALNDSAGKSEAPLTFQVLGDGKVLWSSKPVNASGLVQECTVDMAGVDVLELRVDCPGPYINAQAVWLEPRVLLRQ